MESLLLFDEHLFLVLNRAGQPWLDDIMLLITGIWIWIPLYLGIIYLFFKHFKVADALVFTALCIVGVLSTDQGSVHLFKEVFQRPRPCRVEHLMEQMRFIASYCGEFGFVSSHAANTFGFAALAGGLLHSKLPKARTWLLVWAALVSYSRIYIGVHYPADILGGAIFGIFVGMLLLRLAQKRWLNEG